MTAERMERTESDVSAFQTVDKGQISAEPYI